VLEHFRADVESRLGLPYREAALEARAELIRERDAERLSPLDATTQLQQEVVTPETDSLEVAERVRLRALAKNPNAPWLATPLVERAQTLRRETQIAADELSARAGTLGTVAGLTGELAGMFLTPETLVAALIGAGGPVVGTGVRAIARVAAREAALGVATEIPAELIIRNQRDEVGLPIGFWQSVANVAAAGGLSAAFGGLVRGVVEARRSFRARTDPVLSAARRDFSGLPEADQRTLAHTWHDSAAVAEVVLRRYDSDSRFRSSLTPVERNVLEEMSRLRQMARGVRAETEVDLEAVRHVSAAMETGVVTPEARTAATEPSRAPEPEILVEAEDVLGEISDEADEALARALGIGEGSGRPSSRRAVEGTRPASGDAAPDTDPQRAISDGPTGDSAPEGPPFVDPEGLAPAVRDQSERTLEQTELERFEEARGRRARAQERFFAARRPPVRTGQALSAAPLLRAPRTIEEAAARQPEEVDPVVKSIAADTIDNVSKLRADRLEEHKRSFDYYLSRESPNGINTPEFDALPESPFAGRTFNVVASEDVDPRDDGLVESLLQTVGLGHVKVFVVRLDSSLGRLRDRYQLYRLSPNEPPSSPDTLGALRWVPVDGSYVLGIRKAQSSLDRLSRVETLAHEVGHLVQKEVFLQAPWHIRESIILAHARFVKESNSPDARTVSVFRKTFPRERAEQHIEVEGVSEESLFRNLSHPKIGYTLSFDEWFANQVARWATTDAVPLTVVERFFGAMGRDLKEIYSKAFGGAPKGVRPVPEMEAWLRSLALGSRVADEIRVSAPAAFREARGFFEREVSDTEFRAGGREEVGTNLAEPSGFREATDTLAQVHRRSPDEIRPALVAALRETEGDLPAAQELLDRLMTDGSLDLDRIQLEVQRLQSEEDAVKVCRGNG